MSDFSVLLQLLTRWLRARAHWKIAGTGFDIWSLAGPVLFRPDTSEDSGCFRILSLRGGSDNGATSLAICAGQTPQVAPNKQLQDAPFQHQLPPLQLLMHQTGQQHPRHAEPAVPLGHPQLPHHALQEI